MFAPLSNYDSSTLALLVLVAGVAGLARGFSGFGAALIFMPAASALVGPAVAAPILLVTDGVLSAGFIPPAFRMARRADVAVMAAGAVVGVPTGAFLLKHADPLLLRWFIVSLTAAMLLLLVSGWRYKSAPKPPVTVAVGALAGLFGGIAQLTGPPVVAYWLSGRHSPQAVRANIILFFACTTVLTIVSYLAAGLLTERTLLLSLLVGPLFAVGLYAGARLFGRASEATFRRLCFVLIAISVVSSLPVWS